MIAECISEVRQSKEKQYKSSENQERKENISNGSKMNKAKYLKCRNTKKDIRNIETRTK